jgi:hypothetical protein
MPEELKKDLKNLRAEGQLPAQPTGIWPKAPARKKCRTKGSRKNNFPFSAPIHPAQLRCKNTEYARYSLIFAPC